MTIDLLNQLLTDLKSDDFALDLSYKRSVNRYKASSEELSNTVSQLIEDAVLVANTADETNWDGEQLYCFKGIYFVVSGGGMSNEIIESCSDKRKDELIKLNKNY